MTVDEVRNVLKSRMGNLRCTEVVRLLQELGFEVKPTGRAGHHVFGHPGMPKFIGSNFDCGHGRNPEVKKVYIRNILRTIYEWEEQLKSCLGEGND